MDFERLARLNRYLEMLAPEFGVESLVIDTGDTGVSASVQQATAASFWASAYIDTSILALFHWEDTSHGNPMTAARIGPYAGTASDGKPYGSSMTRRAEGANIVTADPTITTISAALTAHKVGFDVLVNREALDDTEGRLLAALEAMSGPLIAYDSINQLANGSGNNVGMGIRTALAVPDNSARTVTGGAGAPTLDQIEEVFMLVPAEARKSPSACWITSGDNLRATWKSTRDTAGQPVLETPSWARRMGASGAILDKPVFEVYGVPDFAANAKATLVFGVMETVAARRAGEMRFDLSTDGDRWTKDKAAFRIGYRFDCQPMDIGCLAAYSGGSG